MRDKFQLLRKGLLSILFWSVISAAFIGPGTVTTAAKAGESFGLSLLWTLLFSILACFLLQEAAVRIALVTGSSIGRALITGTGSRGGRASAAILVAGSVVVGCAAYEAGNILGAVAGLQLLLAWPAWMLTLAIGALAALALSFSRIETLARMLGGLVVVMGLSFLGTAAAMKPDFSNIASGLLVPSFPAGSGLLVLGLVGTTVVPYNLFLGSGIANRAEGISMMRFGLAISIVLGGLISMAVLVVGSSIEGAFSFTAVSQVLASEYGTIMPWVFAIGLAAAGLTSAITAPLASSITLWSVSGDSAFWRKGGKGYLLTWSAVLTIGMVFGLAGIRPVPVIILAQALNGLILPLVAVVLLLLVNHPGIMQGSYLNSLGQNIMMGLVVFVTILLGLVSMGRSIVPVINTDLMASGRILAGALVLAFLITLASFWKIGQLRKFSGLGRD